MVCSGLRCYRDYEIGLITVLSFHGIVMITVFYKRYLRGTVLPGHDISGITVLPELRYFGCYGTVSINVISLFAAG